MRRFLFLTVTVRSMMVVMAWVTVADGLAGGGGAGLVFLFQLQGHMDDVHMGQQVADLLLQVIDNLL